MSGVPLPDLCGLASLAQNASLDLRPVILRVHTDLFVNAPVRDRAAIEALDALVCGLLPTVDDETAAIVARKLAPLADTPESILRLLAARGGAARRAVIETAPDLSADVLAAAAGDTALDAMVAARPDLSRRQVEALVAKGDDEVDLALARNPRAELSGRALELLIGRARRRAALARALLARPELSGPDAASLYLFADEPRRRAIRAELASFAAARRPSMLRRAERADIARLHGFAVARDGDGFNALLAGMLGLKAATDWRFDDEERHDLLALLLLAAGVPEEDCIRIFLTLEPSIALSVSAVFRLSRLVRETPRSTAVHLVEAILDEPIGAGASHHRPYADPAERSGASRALRSGGERLRPESKRSAR